MYTVRLHHLELEVILAHNVSLDAAVRTLAWFYKNNRQFAPVMAISRLTDIPQGFSATVFIYQTARIVLTCQPGAVT